MPGRSLSRGEMAKVTAVATVGTMLEWYDFFLSGTAAALVFPRVFFPQGLDPTLALIYSFVSAYFIGFVGRPLGAFVFGHIGDRYGRKAGLFWNLILMGLGTIAIGLTPDYASSGYLGLALLMVFRVLQGMGIGGEWGGAVTLVIEQAAVMGSRWRTFWVSWVQQGVPLGSLLSSGTLAVMSALYPGDAFYQVGWRVAYLTGGVTAVVGAVIRWRILESVLFEDLKRGGGTSRVPSVEVFRCCWKQVLLGAVVRSPENASFYIVTSYAVTYISSGLGLSRDLALQSVLVHGIVALIFIFIWSLVSDLLGRKRTMYLGIAILIGIVSWIYPQLLLTKNPLLIFMAQTLPWAIAMAAVYSSVAAFLPEQFPTRYRYSGSGLAYHITAIIAGGLSPILATLLIGSAYVERWWGLTAIFLIYGVAGLLALMPLRETKEARLEH